MGPTQQEDWGEKCVDLVCSTHGLNTGFPVTWILTTLGLSQFIFQHYLILWIPFSVTSSLMCFPNIRLWLSAVNKFFLAQALRWWASWRLVKLLPAFYLCKWVENAWEV